MRTIKLNNKEYIECEVILLPHNNIQTILTLYHDGKFGNSELSLNNDKLLFHTNQYLHIVAKLPITSNDICYIKDLNQIGKCSYCEPLDYNNYWVYFHGNEAASPNFLVYKVIASLDESLMIPTISEEFLIEYIKRYNKKENIKLLAEIKEGKVVENKFYILDSLGSGIESRINIIFKE